VTFDPNQLPMPDLGALCRQCGYPLIGLPTHRCPECGWQFTLDDLRPEGEVPPVWIDGQGVPMTKAIQQILELHEVPFDRNVMDALYGINLGPASPVWLHVDRRLYWDTIHALLSAVGRDSGAPALPPAARSKRGGPPWRCTACGERNPGNFEICWQCQGEVPPPAETA
jgi:hypothetical protein